MKTSELIGPALDWAVAKCEGAYISKESDEPFWLEGIVAAPCFLDKYQPSTDWEQGGPIIEREKIKVDPRKGNWEATIWNEPQIRNPSYGPTPLIAAMRCFVASKLGDEVEIPEELA
jgi:hypothetical protein